MNCVGIKCVDDMIPATVVRYDLPKTSHITIKVFDILGNEVATLVNGVQPPGRYQVQFSGSKYASGVYLVVMKAGSFAGVQKILMIK